MEEEVDGREGGGSGEPPLHIIINYHTLHCHLFISFAYSVLSFIFNTLHCHLFII